MFLVCLRRADDERLYSVSAHTDSGWEIRSEENRTLTRRAEYHDWHRVERMLALFQHEVEALVDQGWQVQPTL
jgi:hypothetical protein